MFIDYPSEAKGEDERMFIDYPNEAKGEDEGKPEGANFID
jgi:hypothetical protein